MKSKLRYYKLLSWFLAILITLQSCVAYKTTNTTITEAAQSGKKALVVNNNNKRMPFKRIEKIDSLYYGIKKAKGKEVRVPLAMNEIKRIRLEDRAMSSLGSIGLIVLGMLAIIIPIKLIELQNDLDSMGGFGKR